jgi:hypothetical protein
LPRLKLPLLNVESLKSQPPRWLSKAILCVVFYLLKTPAICACILFCKAWLRVQFGLISNVTTLPSTTLMISLKGLVGVDPQISQNDGFKMEFVREILPIINEHDAACRAASSSRCENCGSPSGKCCKPQCLGFTLGIDLLSMYWSTPHVVNMNAK